MKTKILLFGTLVLGLLVIIAGSSWAVGRECLAPKKQITIVNPAGRVIEVCVSEAAIPHIGGNGDVVISASCPCFSPDDIQATLNRYTTDIVCSRYDGTTSISGEACTYIECYSPESIYILDVTAVQGPLNTNTSASGNCIFGMMGTKSNNQCTMKDGMIGSLISYNDLTEAEGDACVAVLNILVP